MLEYDIAVIGGGPAGMAAALAAYEKGIKSIVIIDREAKLGGILQQCIHNGFGLHKLGRELTGPEYAEHYAERLRKTDIHVLSETMVTKLTSDKVITAQNRKGIVKIQAKAVILAMGCRERSRGALNICGSRPAGVFSAGTAQKLINCEGYCIGKKAVILGSGDIGLIMARRLTLEGAKVEAVCELLPYSGGLTRNIVQCLEDFGIPLYLSTTVVEIYGKKRVEGVTVAQVDSDRKILENTKRFIPCDTLLLSVGLIPENELTAQAGVAMSPVTGGAIVDETRQTSVPGIFACGNVLHVHDLVDYVSDEAELAGQGAAAYVHGNCNQRTVAVEAGAGVRYVLPQLLHTDHPDNISLYLRVAAPGGKVRVVATSAGKRLASALKLRTAPGEMEKLTINREILESIEDTITVELEEIP